MRALILIALLALGFAAPAAAVEAGGDAAKAENTTCPCGKAVDAKVEVVVRTIEGRTHRIGTCSDECAKAAKADPKKAVKAIEAQGKQGDK